jgi:hypothetical protein
MMAIVLADVRRDIADKVVRREQLAKPLAMRKEA